MPGYGTVTAGAARGLWRASRSLSVDVRHTDSSALARNFNELWCAALNAAHQGTPYDYFAMLHSDVEPQDGWLDTLVGELEAHDLDVVSVPMAIKTAQGLTSTALERPDKDPWRFLCRLTMQEIHRLPETFTSADVGHPLLLNTGCWACRFDVAWAKKVHFTLNDRIVFNTKTNSYQAQMEPEDWFFSRLCHELGLKLGATRKVRAQHVGTHRFGNDQPWGTQDHDEAFVKASVLPDDGFRFPHDVDGWLLYEEGKALAELARGKRVLEVGSYCGRSTICLAQTADVVWAIDPHDGRATSKPKDTSGEMWENVKRYGVARNVRQLIGTLTDHVGSIEDNAIGPFDLIFIDGAHDLASVRADILHATRLLKPDGLLAFHDYRTEPGQHDGRWDPGVTQAVNELIELGGKLVSTHSTVAVVKPPLPVLENCNA